MFCAILEKSTGDVDPISQGPPYKRTELDCALTGRHSPLYFLGASFRRFFMRLSSYSPFALLIFAALGCAVACGDDDDDSGTGKTSKAGSAAVGGDDGGGTGGGGGAPGGDSKLCTDLGGPANINQVVRGDGKVLASDPYNGFKFTGADKKRDGSVVFNAATDPCISQQFAHLLLPTAATQLEHFAECLSLFVQNAAGCDVAYEGAKDKAGKACKDMKTAHTGLGVSDEDYTSLINDAAAALIAAGVTTDSPQFVAVAGALTSPALKADVITNKEPGHSQPVAGMCMGEGDGGAPAADGGAAGAGAVSGGGGAPADAGGVGGVGGAK
jgi:hypothetical protein